MSSPETGQQPSVGSGAAPSAYVRCLAAANKALTAVGYVAYPTLLVLLFLLDRTLLARCIAVPAASFIVVSALRYLYNAPRPYESPDVEPLFPKATKGKSFPSRHTFCMFMIAFTWMVWAPAGIVVGAVLAMCACVMAWIRVRARVHFTRDVIAGVLCAAMFAAVGYIVIPWG